MRIFTKDSSGQPARDREGKLGIEVDDHRLAVLDRFVKQSGFIAGQGGEYGRYSAQDDTNAMAFLVSQLAFIEAEIFEHEYAPRLYQQLLPGSIKFTAGAHVKTVEWFIKDRAGRGRRSSGKSNDTPTVSSTMARKSMPVDYGQIGYVYTQEELRTSAFLQQPLDATLLKDAIEGYEDHMNDVALLGEAESGLTGLFNNASIPQANRPSGAVWSASTPDLILSDINAGIAAVWNATQQRSIPVNMVMAAAAFPALLAPRATVSDSTILKFIQANNLATSRGVNFTITPSLDLDHAGSGGTGRVLFYTPGDQNMIMHIPMPLRFLAPQLENVFIKVPGEYKYSGLAMRRPTTAQYYDGISPS